MKKLSKIKLENIRNKEFHQRLDCERMNRIKGGYTFDTVTVTPSGNMNDGTGCDDGYCGD